MAAAGEYRPKMIRENTGVLSLTLDYCENANVSNLVHYAVRIR